jgi:hypothetical protein
MQDMPQATQKISQWLPGRGIEQIADNSDCGLLDLRIWVCVFITFVGDTEG